MYMKKGGKMGDTKKKYANAPCDHGVVIDLKNLKVNPTQANQLTSCHRWVRLERHTL